MRKRYYARRRKVRRVARARFYIIVAALAVALAVGIFFIVKAVSEQPGTGETASESVPLSAPVSIPSDEPTESPSESATDSPVTSAVTGSVLPADLTPAPIQGETDPATFGFTTHVYVDGAETSSYTRPDPISFGSGSEYNTLDGVTTYRSNNWRDGASVYGTAEIASGTLTVLPIEKTTGSSGGSVRSWSGSACTGQPIIVTWPDATRKLMGTLYDEFQNSTAYHDDFTEVIIASADGRIYFMELSTGTKTRDPIVIGSPTKGTPSLDPRGWPILYVGQGLDPSGSTETCKSMYFRVYNLVTGQKIYDFGADSADPVALRNWQAYDASPLIDAETDTLIEPGENGVLYTIKLNTTYDEATGNITMNPGPMVKYTYSSTRNASTRIYGMENSPVGWRNYVFFTDNAGMLQCVDLNTMSLVYANDLENDSDVSMVLEEDADANTFYLYTGCEYDDNVAQSENTTGTCYARKINGLTGHIEWSVPFTVYTDTSPDASVDGGILASPILGKEGTTAEGLIIYTISSVIKEDGGRTAMMVALDKDDGSVVWTVDLENSGWTPSSAAAVYTADGKCYIVQCLYQGTVKLIRVDGATANGASVVSSVNVSEAFSTDEANSFEATPAVFGNTIVVGSKSGHFFFLTIS